MSLTVKHLNGDASFLLTFEPIPQVLPTAEPSRDAFTIVLDPWLTGPSKIWHPKFSISTQKQPPCISSLTELPEPDLVVISQGKDDHCHERTLKTLPPSGGKTLILAGPPAAKTIRGWKYFDSHKVVTLPKWEARFPSAVHRIPLAPLDAAGTPGEVTVAFIDQKFDITGLHTAVGITYRPPTSGLLSLLSPMSQAFPLTPPASPKSSYAASFSRSPRTLSVIHSPHGCSYKTLKSYASSHLVTEAALPLTALLHSFDRITNTWYLGGNICAGLPGGQEIAQSLLARCWISAHDADKDTKGFASKKLAMEKHPKKEIEDLVSPRSEKFPERRTGTEVVILGVGEEIRVGPELFGLD